MAASAVAANLLPSSMSLSLTRPHATTDSRLLQNLIKSERTYIGHLASTVQSSSAAAAALKAWGTSESRDVAQASATLADLLEDVADAQNNHLEAIKGYREALKDVADREASIRTIVKDRDILVSRLIKASRKNGDVPHAQRELTACEEVLEAEERALVGVKRRTFKEALSMRMKLMGDAGNRMIENAKEAILLLDEFDQHASGDDRRSFNHTAVADDEYRYHDSQAQTQYDQNESDPYPAHRHQESWGNESGDPYQYASPDAHYAGLEAASVTPSQSASQTAHGSRYGTGPGYQRPAFPGGAPHESAEERADSDASSEADDVAYTDARANFNSFQSPALDAPPIPSKDAHTIEDGQSQYFPNQPLQQQSNSSHQQEQQDLMAAPAPPLRPARESRPRESSPYAGQPQPQMHVVTAPRFNYDGTQLSAVPQAPRLFNRDEENSSSDDEPQNTTAHRGWTSRPTRGGDSSDEGDYDAGRGKPSRPKAEKRSSFFGKMGKLFKTDLKEGEHGGSASGGHRRQNSTSDRGSSHVGGYGEQNAWQSRTDQNLKASRKESLKALGGQQSKRQSLLRPLPNAPGNESSSDDEDHRADLVRNVNPAWSGRNATSDVGVSLKRTPSQQHSITAGPLSVKQRREMEERERADHERKTREAVLGAGVGSALPQRSNTVKSSATTKKKKKKASGRPSSIAGSEVGTAATRSSPLVTATAPGPQRPGSYIVHGDLSSGNRGLASLVLPSDIAKDQERTKAGYPSQLQPPSGSGLTRSNSTATNATGKSTIKKKKKRQSAISEGPGTGLAAMSPKDGGKYTTSNWVQSNQTGGANKEGLANSAVANAGLVPHTPATQEQIAKKQASAGASISRPSSAQATPLKSALKQHNAPQNTPLKVPEATLGPIVQAPPSASAILAESRNTVAGISAEAPLLPTPQPNISTPLEEKMQRQVIPNIGDDGAIDGSGRFLSRENSTSAGLDLAGANTAANGEAQAGNNAAQGSRKVYQAPKIEMPSSEPFNIDYARLEGQRGGRRTNEQGPDEIYSAALTPNESATYQKWLETAPTSSESETPIAPSSQQRGPQGVSRVTANRHRIGRSVDLDNEPSQYNHPGAPSRTYSSEGKTLHTGRSGTISGASSSTAQQGAGGAGLAATLMLPSSTSGGQSDVSGGTAESHIARRKSVRIAPDTKLPPETPPPNEQGQVSDGFGGFVSPYTTSSLYTASAPSPAVSRSESVKHGEPRDPSASTLSSRIAPPPQAPPRLPTKEGNPQLSTERERSGWTTRIDRRLASTYDSSDDEDGEGAVGGGGAGNGEGIDAYASARRAMGMAQRHWTEATSPAKKKASSTKKNGTNGSAETGSVRSKSSKKKASVSASGYNKDIPLPKGMEVVGRQKASKA
ncbi:unnamed protein product [Sympodiomycopsis kandeliae]